MLMDQVSPFGLADPSQSLVGNPTGHWDFRLQNVFVTPSGPVTPGPTTLPPDARLAVAPQVPAYITAPTALFNAHFQDLDELHRRLGEIRDEQAIGLPQHGEVFYRAYGSTFNFTSARAASLTSASIRARTTPRSRWGAAGSRWTTTAARYARALPVHLGS